MGDIGWESYAVDSEGIVDDLCARRVVQGDDVVPSIGCKALKSDAAGLPVLGGVVEHSPSIAGIVCLPGVVVRVPVGVLLTLKFQRLRGSGILSGDIQVEFVAEIAHRSLHRRLLDEVV